MKRLTLTVCLLLAAFAGCSGGGDGDSLPADAEASGWNVLVTYPNSTERSYNVTSDPTQTDTDGDGLDDFDELDRGTDPRSIDTDNDRLLDGSTLCPDEGSALADSVDDRNVLAHPDREGCYLGESRTEVGGLSYRTSPTDAHSDSSPQLTDTMDDGTELVGWKVELADGETYQVRSNPGLRNADTDQDGLHDGLERRLKTDPTKKDTEGDGSNDVNDAAPKGNLHVTAHIRSINLKTDFNLGGGADLLVDVSAPRVDAAKGPKAIDSGKNRLDWSLDLDVSDRGSAFTEELGGAYASGSWTKNVRFTFHHDASGDDEEPIDVRSNGGSPHVLVLSYDAFADSWTGHATGGTSSGPDADVTVDLSSRIE